MALVSQKEYARRRRVTPQYINKLVRAGKIPLVSGRIDPARADKALAGWRRPARHSKAAEAAEEPSPRYQNPRVSASGTLTAARAKTETYKAALAQMEYKKAIGELLPRADVVEAERRKNTNIRTRFRRLARSLAPELARTTDAAACEALVLAAIDRELAELAGDPLGTQPPISAEERGSSDSQLPDHPITRSPDSSVEHAIL